MIELKLRTKERNQMILIVTVCMMICFSPIVHFINLLCRNLFGRNFSFDSILCYSIFAGMLLASLKQLHLQIKIDALLIYIFFAVAFALSYAFNDASQKYMFTTWTDVAGNPAYQLFVFSLPAYVFMRYITDYDRLFATCQVFSAIVVFCSLGSFIIMLLRNSQPEYMNFSYNLLFPAICASVCFFEKKKAVALVAAIIAVGLIFFAGARGPLICYLFGLAVYFIICKYSPSKKVFILLFLVIISLLCMLFWQELLLMLKSFADSLGISSRTIELLLEGNFGSDSGRGEIQRKIIEGFTLFGKGLYGDRVIGENHYSHNLIIELISEWGYLLGLLIVGVLGMLLFKGLRTKNNNLQLLIFVFFSASVVKLMLSESYLANNAVFYVLLAACVNSFDAKEMQPALEALEPIEKKSKYIRTLSRYG